MRTVAVVSAARSDYSVLRPVLRRIVATDGLRLRIMATGAHLSPEFGMTVDTIVEDGFDVAERIETLLPSDAPEGIAESIGLGVSGFARAFARSRPDVLVVMGDRIEMFAAAIAALPFTIPVAHIHGGELSQGAIDDAMRHSISKLSHLHFVATDEAHRRVIQLGEAPWRVTVSGAPALDNLRGLDLTPADELGRRHGLALDEPPLVVTFHPTTLEYENTAADTRALLDALARTEGPMVFTSTNADTAGRQIIGAIHEFVDGNDRAQSVVNLGTDGYYSLLALASAMVGNSSSGIIEAASFGLPVVNVGNRQSGRLSGRNVIHCAARSADILAAIERATSAAFRDGLRGMSNPYGDGHAAGRIVERLRTTPLDSNLIVKLFHDLPAEAVTASAAGTAP